MSDIPRARNILKWALKDDLDLEQTRKAIRRALNLMVRKSPEFRVHDDVAPLTSADRKHARKLRAKGLSVRRIAEMLQTNIGRVSEAVSRPNA